MFVRLLVRVFRFLTSENSNTRISISVVWGMFLGLTPVFTIQWVLALAGTLILRVNFIVIAISAILFSVVGSWFEPNIHRLGLHILTEEKSLIPMWKWMYHAPVLPYTGFNHTIVMGTWVIGTLAVIPVFILSFYITNHNRARVYQAFRATRIYRMYANYRYIAK